MSDAHEDQIALDLLCCVMVADKLASGVEKQLISDLLKQDDCPWTDAEIAGRIKNFAARVKDGGLELTIEKVCSAAQGLELDRLREIFEDCLRVAKADGDFTRRETRVLNRIQELLPNLRLQLIAEHHPEAAKPSDPRTMQSADEHSTSGGVRGVVGLILTIIFIVAWIASTILDCDFRRKFESIKPGMMSETVVDLLGEPFDKRRHKTEPVGFKSDADKESEVHTQTTMIWGDRSPRYTDEYRYTVDFYDGRVTSKDVTPGTERRDNNN